MTVECNPLLYPLMEPSLMPVTKYRCKKGYSMRTGTMDRKMLAALIERSLRRGMEREGSDRLPVLPEGRQTKTPTTARLLEMFSDVSWYEFERGEETVTFPIKLSPLQKRLLKLLDMDPSSYS